MDQLNGQIIMGEVAEIIEESRKREYSAFVDKFKPSKTTDDCYTPQNIHDALVEWVANEYGLNPSSFLRPFKPEGDYQAEEYPEGCVVVDNPPFSILAQIIAFYTRRNVPFFLYGPALTILSYLRGENKDRLCALCTGVGITYENGANVNTSFITNLERGRYCYRTAPDLRSRLDAENKKNQQEMTRELPSYRYPDQVITGASYTLGKYGQDLRISPEDCVFIRELDAQKAAGKSIFGAGLLLSEKAAAEKAAAEKAAAEKAAAEKAAAEKAAAELKNKTIWELSRRERAIISGLGKAHS